MRESERKVPATYQEWDAAAHERVREEPVWQFLGYRKALFLYDLVWEDRLVGHRTLPPELSLNSPIR